MSTATTTDVDSLFVYTAGVLVFFMHVGFAMLEVGGVQSKNRSSILLKNIVNICASGLSWWALGYLLATGVNMSSQDLPGFLGKSDGSDTSAFLADLEKIPQNLISSWFFGFAVMTTLEEAIAHRAPVCSSQRPRRRL